MCGSNLPLLDREKLKIKFEKKNPRRRKNCVGRQMPATPCFHFRRDEESVSLKEETVCACVCKKERERERGRKSMCVRVCVRERVSV